jgi:hypothetical protein
MSIRIRFAAVLVAAPLVFAGCASSASHAPSAHEHMTPGMVMPDGSTMGAMAAGDTVAQPSAAAKMICSADTASKLKTVLALPSQPTGRREWSAPDLTCTYALPVGTLILSVHEAGTQQAGTAYIDGVRRKLGAGKVIGLTDTAYGTAAGDILLLKDGDVLHVDATRLPAVFPPDATKRADFAYQIATDILGCWTGDE